MGGDAFLLTLVAAFAVFLGLKVERTRRAAQDARRLAQAVSRMRVIRIRETLNTTLIIFGTVAVLFLLARGG